MKLLIKLATVFIPVQIVIFGIASYFHITHDMEVLHRLNTKEIDHITQKINSNINDDVNVSEIVRTLSGIFEYDAHILSVRLVYDGHTLIYKSRECVPGFVHRVTFHTEHHAGYLEIQDCDDFLHTVKKEYIEIASVQSVSILFLTCLFLYVFYYRGIHLRLHRIRVGMESFNKGNVFYRISDTSDDIISNLTHDVNVLFGRIERMSGSLDDINRQEIESDRLEWVNATLHREVEERKRAQAELQKTYDNLVASREQLVQSEKLASLGKLVASIAHEVNTPIGIGVTMSSRIQDLTEKLKGSIEADALTKKGMERYLDNTLDATSLILRSLEDATNIIRSFKQISTDRYSQDKRTFNIKEYLGTILVSLKPTLKNCPHTIHVDSPDLEIYSNPGIFSQIITNFLNNTLLHAYEEDQSGTIQIQVTDTQHEIIVRYSDDGRGVGEEELSKIFDPFYTTNRVQGGTGLGLHIVYQLVKDILHGQIECYNGTGLTFVVRIPKDQGRKEGEGE